MKNKPRILVLGLNGLIGWHLFGQAREHGEAFGTYRRENGPFDGPGRFRIDFTDAGEVREFFLRLRPEIVLHAWAMCDLDVCEGKPEIAWKVNVEGTRTILNAAHLVPELRKFVYLSTDHVFDGRRGSYHEDDTPCPGHVYGRTKAEAERMVRESGLPYLIVRPGLVIGPSAQGNKGPRDFLLTRLRAGKPTHYFTDEWRTPIRARALASRVLSLALSGEEGIFHVAGQKAYNRYELARHLAVENRLPTEHIFPRLRKEDAWAAIRPENITLSSRRSEAARHFFDEGTEETYETQK